MKEELCDFCKVEEIEGVYSTHLPISLGYCKKCLKQTEIRTLHNVNMNWSRSDDDKYLEHDYTVYFKGEYLQIKDYANKVTIEDIKEIYPKGYEFLIDALDKKIIKLKLR